MDTCESCNCPRCLTRRAATHNPAVVAAFEQAWVHDNGWGLRNPPAVRGQEGVEGWGDYPLVPAQARAYSDDHNPLNEGTFSRPRPSQYPGRWRSSPIEWVLACTPIVAILGILGVVVWAVSDIGQFFASHGTQIISGLVALVIVIAVVALIGNSRGGGGTFSGTFSGRWH